MRKAELPGPRTEGALLDLGCGYGPIACVLATLAPNATVYATDVNSRALELTRANAAALGVGVDAREPDAIPADVRFAELWSNPPIRIGKQELRTLLLRWLPRLAPGGRAVQGQQVAHSKASCVIGLIFYQIGCSSQTIVAGLHQLIGYSG